MATIKRELSTRTDTNGKSEIICRLSLRRGLQPRLHTGVYVSPTRFKGGKFVYPRANQKEAAALRADESRLIAVEQMLLHLCETSPVEALSKEALTLAIDEHNHPERYAAAEAAPRTFYGTFEEYLSSRKFSDWRIKHYRVLLRALKRFEAYTTATTGEEYKITLDGFNADGITAFEWLLRHEPETAAKHPEIYAAPGAYGKGKAASRAPLPKGNNTIVCMFSRLRAFFNWCNEMGITDNKPFAKYKGTTSEQYGTPYYITIEERDQIADTDLTASPELAAQRDIFVFQCLIGCRVSDLLRLTPSNVVNGAIEYIAAKTKEERPQVIRVPLHRRAAEILAKYEPQRADLGGRLLPFISAQKYNAAIKKIFTATGVTRRVTILNPTTGQEEQRPINEIAASHLARRTFVGNLYKQVKDPNLVGKLSGHKEGSKAFARYRDIDEDMKRDLINLLGK